MGQWWGTRATGSSESRSWTPVTALLLLRSSCSHCYHCHPSCPSPPLALLDPQLICSLLSQTLSHSRFQQGLGLGRLLPPPRQVLQFPWTLTLTCGGVCNLAWWARRSQRQVQAPRHSCSDSFFPRRILQIPENSFFSKSAQPEALGYSGGSGSSAGRTWATCPQVLL